MHTGYSRECLYITSFAWSQPSPWHVTNSSFDIWNFLKNFPPNNFDLQLIESADMTPWIREPTVSILEIKSSQRYRLHSILTVFFLSLCISYFYVPLYTFA